MRAREGDVFSAQPVPAASWMKPLLFREGRGVHSISKTFSVTETNCDHENKQTSSWLIVCIVILFVCVVVVKTAFL